MTQLSNFIRNKIGKNRNEKLYKDVGTTPIWLLRQAGRYMPEYQEIRNELGGFLDLCYSPEKACEVTMQPINRFDMDSAILFADILTLPHSIGWDVEFKKNEGPVLKKFTEETIYDLNYPNLDQLLKIVQSDKLGTTELDSVFDEIKSKVNNSKAENIYLTVKKIRDRLDPNKSLIGFAGSPWTVASYMIEGRGKHDFSYSKSFIYNNRKLALFLIGILVIETIEYLSSQIKAGADIVMLFDSWSGVLNGSEYDDFVINPTKKIISAIKSRYPEVPIIGFPRCSGYNYDKYIDYTGIDVVSVDQFTPLEVMSKWKDKVVVQGNLDPVVLLSGKSTIKTKVDEIFGKLGRKNFIFNLGHGILQNTDPENVKYLVDYVKSK